MLSHLKRFAQDRSGVSVVEYSLLTGIVAITAITGLGELSDALLAVYYEVSNTLNEVTAHLSVLG